MMAGLMSGVVLVSVVVLVCAWKVFDWLWWKPKRLERYFREQGIKGPSYKLIHGNLRENSVATEEARAKPMRGPSHAIVPRVLPFLHQTVEKYGKFSIFWVGNIPRINVMEPDLVRDVLSNKFGHFTKMRPNPFIKLFATGLGSYNGEKWVKHRRIINPAFHIEKLKMMLPAFYTSCDLLISRWEELAVEGSFELDVVPEFQRLTKDIISRTAFGSNFEEGKRIFELQSEQLELVVPGLQLAYVPGSRFLPTKRNKRMKEIRGEIGTLLREMIEKREKALKLGEVDNEDLLSMLIDSNLKEIHEHKNPKNVGLSIDEIIEECKLFYFAGQETTSTLLLWTIVLLSMHQEWQEKAREEVLHAFGRSKPDFDGLSRLKIIPMILYEVLRLYPPFCLLTRLTYKEMKIGEVTLPPGVIVGLPILLINHDRDVWGEDVEEFNPERFSGGISKAAKYQVSFFSFGWGPRICIGQNFALIEVKMALVMILQHFSFELSPSYVHAPHVRLSLHPQYGAQILFHKL
ncbi:hypothetical protein Sjap_025650 [Stephania japonica]|uniref:Cytochrome P450 n=1 Tax=Stephania japonica TaxID=461633 RepID=A0AAP0E9X6_9MAGN